MRVWILPLRQREVMGLVMHADCHHADEPEGPEAPWTLNTSTAVSTPMMLISPMDALTFSLCLDTRSLACCVPLGAERHPLVFTLRHRVRKLPDR